MYFKNIVDALGHTPLIELNQTSPSKKVKILVKLEGQNPGGSASIKDRVAKYMIEKAEQSGELTKDKTIVEATSGNTGIALAWLWGWGRLSARRGRWRLETRNILYPTSSPIQPTRWLTTRPPPSR